MRHVVCLVVVGLMSFAAPVFAAVPQDLQKILQAQFAEMKQQSQGRLTTTGDIKVEGDNIIYPAMKVMVTDMKSSWIVPSTVLRFTGPAKNGNIPFALQLPSNFQQKALDGKTLLDVVLSGQTVTGEWSQKENTIARLDAQMASVMWDDVTAGTKTTARDIVVKTMSNFVSADKVNMLVDIQTKKFTRLPEGFGTTLMPETSSLTGQIKALPKSLVVFGALVPVTGVQGLLAQTGTQFDINEVKMITANGASMTGNGWFKAAQPDSQFPVSGRMNIEWQNLQQVLTSLQQGFSAGSGNRAQSAQSMVLLMLLQGMGKTVDKTTQYTVDMTPDGNIMLNGQDVTAMFTGPRSMLNMFSSQPSQSRVPAFPVTPVMDEGAI